MADQLYVIDTSTGTSTNVLSNTDAKRLAPTAIGRHYGILINPNNFDVILNLDHSAALEVELYELEGDTLFADLSSNDNIDSDPYFKSNGKPAVVVKLKANSAYLLDKNSSASHGLGVKANAVTTSKRTARVADKHGVIYIDRGTNAIPAQTT